MTDELTRLNIADGAVPNKPEKPDISLSERGCSLCSHQRYMHTNVYLELDGQFYGCACLLCHCVDYGY